MDDAHVVNRGYSSKSILWTTSYFISCMLVFTIYYFTPEFAYTFRDVLATLGEYFQVMDDCSWRTTWMHLTVFGVHELC